MLRGLSNIEVKASLHGLLKGDLQQYLPKRSGVFAYIIAYMFHPGFTLLVRHRFAVFLYKGGRFRRIVALLVWRSNTKSWGCHISLEAHIESGLFLPHPTGIVIGDNVHIGKDVTIYQNVTLGKGSDNGYPAIRDGATIYAGSVVVGELVIGEHAILGASSFLTKLDLPSGATAAGIPARIVNRPTV